MKRWSMRLAMGEAILEMELVAERIAALGGHAGLGSKSKVDGSPQWRAKSGWPTNSRDKWMQYRELLDLCRRSLWGRAWRCWICMAGQSRLAESSLSARSLSRVLLPQRAAYSTVRTYVQYIQTNLHMQGHPSTRHAVVAAAVACLFLNSKSPLPEKNRSGRAKCLFEDRGDATAAEPSACRDAEGTILWRCSMTLKWLVIQGLHERPSTLP